jgi:serine protease AprX
VTETRTARARTAAIAAVLVVLASLVAPAGGDGQAAGAPPGADVAEALERAGTVSVIVQATEMTVAAAITAVEDTGGEVTAPLPIIEGFAGELTRDGLEALRTIEGVTVTLDTPIEFGTADSTTTGASDDFYARTVRAHRLHNRGIDGSGVGIAVIDTGVNAVQDLAGRVVGGVDLSAEGDGVDRYGHGTFVAAIAAGDGSSSKGRLTGVAPGAHVVPVKIAGENGAADVSHILAAMQWVVSYRDAHDIGVVNMSFGTDSPQPARIDPLNHAVQRVWDEGMVVVVSAANAGPDQRTIMKPADDPLVITVGATDSHDTVEREDDTVAAFSSRGPTRADGLAKPDLVAPGVRTVSARSVGSTLDDAFPQARVGEHHFRGSGTSFSAAVVSGASALLRQAHPGWTPDQIKGALLGTAATGPVGDPHVDGHGAVDVAAAAELADPEPANQDVARSTGHGSLDDSRGSLRTAISQGPSGAELSGDLTAKGAVFERTEYVAREWNPETWLESQWYAGNWYAGNWYAGNWYAGNWYAGNWYAGNWYAGNWYAGNWYAGNWYAGNWYGASWE